MASVCRRMGRYSWDLGEYVGLLVGTGRLEGLLQQEFGLKRQAIVIAGDSDEDEAVKREMARVGHAFCAMRFPMAMSLQFAAVPPWQSLPHTQCLPRQTECCCGSSQGKPWRGCGEAG